MTVTPRSFLPGTLSVTAGNGPIAGYTQRYNLNLTNFDWVTWHDYEWENWVVIDALLNAALQGTVIEGAWKPNTAYALNDVVVDIRDGTMLICVSAHTSSESLDADIAAGKWGDYDISGAPVTVDSVPPTTPKPGDLWFATVEPVGLYVWYNDGNSSQWVQTNGGSDPPDLPLTGGTLSGALYIDAAYPNMRLISSTPSIQFLETDAASPTGQFSLRGYGVGNFGLSRFTGADFTTEVHVWRYIAGTGNFIFDVPVFMASTAPVIANGGVVIAGSAPSVAADTGAYRLINGSGQLLMQRALTDNFASFAPVFGYNPTTGSFSINASLSVGASVNDFTGTSPRIRFSETDQIDPAGRYQFIATSNRFFLQSASGVNWSATDTVWSHDGTTDLLNIAKRTSFSGAGAETWNVKIDATYPSIWFHDSTPSGSYANMMISAGNSNFRFSTCDAAGELLDTFVWASPLEVNMVPFTRLASTGGVVELGASNNAQLRFQREGSINHIQVPTGASLRIQNASGTAWATINGVSGWSAGTSDARMKLDIRDIGYGLDTVMQLRAVEFDWAADGRHDIGLIAQEVEPIIPEIVERWDSDDPDRDFTYALRKDALVAVLIKAVQELALRLHALESK